MGSNNKYTVPPKWADRFLLLFCREELVEEILGDLHEYYEIEAKDLPPFQARLFYWYHVINFLRPFALRKSYHPFNNVIMYKSYFKIGFRNIMRNLAYSAINIGGLAVGMSVAILIGLWIHYELSYDQYHENYDHIAQVMQKESYNGKVRTMEPMPFPIADELRNNYGDNFKYVAMSTWVGDHILSYEGKSLIKKGNYMDVDVPKMLSLEMLAGSREGLSDPGSIMLAESAAKAFFGEEDPMGKLMMIDNELNVMVTGVYKDIPTNTRFGEMVFIAPWMLFVNSYDWVRPQLENPDWNDSSYLCFAQIADNTDMQTVGEKIIKAKYNVVDEMSKTFDPKIILHPMKDWHLRTNWINGVKAGGPIQYVWLFGVIGIFVLILACINFMNLSTAQSERRAKEVGVRKSLGSAKGQLISQFLIESLLVVSISFLLAIILVNVALPSFNLISNKDISFPFLSPLFWMISLGFVVFTGFLAGSYPALYLSSFDPVSILKGTLKAGASATLFRRALVVLQFTVSVALIIGTIGVNQQIQYSKNREIGYDNNGVIMFEVTTTDYENKYHILRDALIKRGAASDMSHSSSPLTALWNRSGGFEWEGKDPELQSRFATVFVTHDYGKTIDWEIVQGRDFSREFKTDSTAYIINETAMKYMEMDDPIGKTIRWGRTGEHEIIGVIKDIVMESPFQVTKPTIYIMDYTNNTNWVNIELNDKKSAKEAIAITEEVFADIVPNVPFEFLFADESYARKFAATERIRKLASIFAVLAIFISCLGLFGLASFMVSQRTKEIGIRKVLGATVFNLWQLLSKDFMILVAISCLIAIPIAYYGLSYWLDNFDYRTALSWWFFAIACLGALLITIVTVSFQSIRAALMNPVNSLKTE